MIVRSLQLIYKISIKINAYDRFDDATNGHFPSKFQLSVFFCCCLRQFVGCQLKFSPFVSSQLTPSRPSFAGCSQPHVTLGQAIFIFAGCSRRAGFNQHRLGGHMFWLGGHV